MKNSVLISAVLAAAFLISCSGNGITGANGLSVLYLQEEMNPSDSYTGSRTIAISSMYPTSTSSSALNCGVSSSSGITQSLLYFPLLGFLPSNAVIEAAYLTLYCTSESSTAGGNTVNCYAMTTDFTASATWNTSNGSSVWSDGGGDYDDLSKGAGKSIKVNAYNDIPVKASVIQGWLASSDTNHGLALVPKNKTTSDSMYNFISNFETANPELRPMLKIYYRLP